MLAFERREKILSTLYSDKKVFVAPLASTFNVTEETIRRDLEKLEREGVVTRNYGGATLNNRTSEDLPYQTRNTINLEEKRIIAQLVPPLVKDGSSIMADTSSTVYEALQVLQQSRDHLTIITNSVSILQDFAFSSFDVFSTGGSLRKNSRSLVGPSAIRSVQQYNVDAAVVSCKGISMTQGIMDTNEPEADLKQYMQNQARQVILLVDHTKFGAVSLVKTFPFKQVDCLLTNKQPSEEWLDFFEQHEIDVIFPS